MAGSSLWTKRPAAETCTPLGRRDGHNGAPSSRRISYCERVCTVVGPKRKEKPRPRLRKRERGALPARLEVSLQAELEYSRVESRRDLAEVAGRKGVADTTLVAALELRVIEDVETFGAQFEVAAALLAEHEALE